MKQTIAFTACGIMLLTAAGCRALGPDKTVRISFIGDIIMHIPVKTCALVNDRRDDAGRSLNNGGFDYVFARVREALTASDLIVGNMEFPVSPPFESRPYVFNCRPEVLGAMKNAGIGLVTLANNHITDQGEDGMVSTMSYLRQHGIGYIGGGASEAEARGGHVFVKHGLSVGIIAYTGVMNKAFPAPSAGIHINNFYKKERVLEDIDALKGRSDYRAMVVHYGDEYSAGPAPRDEALIREYMERGIDLFIGHHPHLLQRVERYGAADGRECFIFYSLGNFISNQSSETAAGLSTRDSVIVTALLEKKGEAVSRRFEVTPIRTVNETATAPSGRQYRSIQPVPVGTEIRELAGALEHPDAKVRARAEKQHAFLRGKISIIRHALVENRDYRGLTITGAGRAVSRQ